MIYDTSSLDFLEFLTNEQHWPRHFILAVKTGQRLHRQRIYDEAFGCPSVYHALFSGGSAMKSDGGGLAGRSERASPASLTAAIHDIAGSSNRRYAFLLWFAESRDVRRSVWAPYGVSP